MRETNYANDNPVRPGWVSVLAYLALPLLLFTAAVVLPLLNPPPQGSHSPIDPAARAVLIQQWNETYTPRPAPQHPVLVVRPPTPVAVFVAGH